jgi:HAMP domain-containing protein
VLATQAIIYITIRQIPKVEMADELCANKPARPFWVTERVGGFALMRYVPRSVGDLHSVLNRRLSDEMPVEASEEIGISAKSVGELRRLSSWPRGLVVETPLDPSHRESTVKISIVSRQYD